MEKLLNSEEAAALLGIHQKVLQRFARCGQIPGLKIGKLWRFRASALDEWATRRLTCSDHPCREKEQA